MKRLLPFLLIFSFLLSCTNEDDPVTETFPCKIMKCGKSTFQSGIGTDPIDYYTTEFVYQNDRIIKRLNYNGYAQLATTDSIAYNSMGHVSGIYYHIHQDDIYGETKTELFSYHPNTDKPYRRETRLFLHPWNELRRSIEDIQYDASGRILKTIDSKIFADDLPDFYNITTTDYTYDLSGNLEKFVETVAQNVETTRTTTYLFSNFDTGKNPFRTLKVPFANFRHLMYSLNNRRAYEITEQYEGMPNPSFHSITTLGNFDYNEYGYPLIAEYQCH
ncbi:MAG: hypothetical protein V4535_00135 [Bacteroidota bacterium]